MGLNPLFIGEVSSTRVCLVPLLCGVRVSIPSSSGKSLQLALRNLERRAGCRSQSPLHRGSLFNISFPNGMSGREFCLNPLFIGEVSSTPMFATGQVLGFGFNPLFIGEVSSTLNSPTETRAALSFNPLFIGEVSSTRLK